MPYGYELNIPDPLLQSDLEEYEAALKPLIEGDVPLSVVSGAIVKAAILVGWLRGLGVDEVRGLRAGVVAGLSLVVHKAVQAGRVPPLDPGGGEGGAGGGTAAAGAGDGAELEAIRDAATGGGIG